MILENTLRTKLAELPALDTPQKLAFEQAGWNVTLTVDTQDRLGCLLWEVVLARTPPITGTQADWGKRLAERVRGLHEPLQLLEVDAARGEAILRSSEPTRRETGAVQYFEVKLTGLTALHLQRFQGYPEPQRRDAVAFALTHESLARLVNDLTSEA